MIRGRRRTQYDKGADDGRETNCIDTSSPAVLCRTCHSSFCAGWFMLGA